MERCTGVAYLPCFCGGVAQIAMLFIESLPGSVAGSTVERRKKNRCETFAFLTILIIANVASNFVPVASFSRRTILFSRTCQCREVHYHNSVVKAFLPSASLRMLVADK
eukprot:5474881-Pleurochrysis_carterae.AAC.3